MAKVLLSISLFLLFLPNFFGAYGDEKVLREIPSWASQFEVDRIEIKGVTLFSSQIVEGALEIAPGDKFERAKVLRSEQNLLSLYRLHGFYDVAFQIRLVKKEKEDQSYILEFEIHEGKPVKIDSIQLSFISSSEQESKELNTKWEKKVKRILGVKEGDPFDQEKIVEHKKNVQELLAAKEYIGSKVDYYFDDRDLSSKSGHGADLKFVIDVGEKVSFGFRENTFFTRGYLDSIVDEMRLVGLGKDYVGAIKSRLEEEYRSAGFAEVDVKPYVVELPYKTERRVTYFLNEGNRVKIDTIDFDGNVVFSVKELQEKFFARASGLVQNRFYVEKDVNKAAELVVESMKEKGYLFSKLITVNVIYLAKVKTRRTQSAVKILIYLYEGDQTLVRNITVNNSTVFQLKQIENFIHQSSGSPLNLFAYEEGVEALKKAYFDRGFLDFRISNEGPESMIRYSQENRYADIVLDLSEGPPFRVSQVEIEGLEKTKEYIIWRELKFKVGEILRESEIIESERLLRRLGIFSSVTIRAIDDAAKPDFKIVRITLREADRGILTWGPGIRNDLGIRLFSQFAYTNLWGMNHTASFNVSVNRRFYMYNFAEGQAQLDYAWPWFGIPHLTFRPSIFMGQTQYNNFAATTLNTTTLWEKPLLNSPLLIGSFAYTLEKINQFNAPAAIDNQQLLVGTLTPKLSLDLRDNPLSPTSGLFTTSWFDFAYPSLGSQDDLGYYRIQFRMDYYFQIFQEIVCYLSFRTGYEQSIIRDPDPAADSIPLIKQFALGGIGSVRGYQQQEINQTYLLQEH
jgi:outer membrane protein assembly complex protein YaeT